MFADTEGRDDVGLVVLDSSVLAFFFLDFLEDWDEDGSWGVDD